MPEKNQGSIEYLVIIAAVIAISAIVVLFSSGFFSTSKKTGDVSECMQAASRCYTEKAVSSTAECSYCEQACSGLSACKLAACKEGNPSKVKVIEEAGLCSQLSFFDDFNSSNINSSIWIVDPARSKVFIEDGELVLGDASDAEHNEGRVLSVPVFKEGMVEFRARIINNTPDGYSDGYYHNLAYVRFENYSQDFNSYSGFMFYDFNWPGRGSVKAFDEMVNKNPDKVQVSANNGLSEYYSSIASIPLSDTNPEEYHTYTLTWRVVNGVNVNSFYIDCEKVMESNTSYPYPRKIVIYGNYKQVRIDWIRTCGITA